MEFFLITKVLEGEKHLLLGKSQGGLARINAGLENCIYLGNIDSLRDWGHAKDYVEMQWLMMQLEKPQDFIIATGRQESVRRFIELSAKEIGWEDPKSTKSIIWEGEG